MSGHLLFATIAAGGGHVATARAMAEAVDDAEPGRGTRVSDFMLELGLDTQDRRHKEGWRWLLARPALVRSGQRLLEIAPGAVVSLQRRLLDRLARRSAEALAAERPALVVANHGFLAVALTRAQQRYGLNVPVVVFATEPFDANALWAEPRAERVVAPSAPAKAHLVRLGVPAERVDVVGYPVQRAFLEAPSRSAARSALGLEPRFTCLLSLGGEGIVRDPAAVVRPLLEQGIQLVAVAGRNLALKEYLTALAGDEHGDHQGGRLVVVGYSERMAELIAAADVVVGKAGPASTMEALAVGRYLGLTSYAGLNERAVVRFVRSKKLGEFVPSRDALASAAARWRAEADAGSEDESESGSESGGFRAAEARARLLDFRGMGLDLANYLEHFARHRRPPESWHSRGLA